jgi:hypothetical protein
MQPMSSLDHIRHLTESIGPRGSTTEGEAKAADYVADQLAALGLNPQRQRFLSAESAYAPLALGAGLALLSLVLFWQPQPVGALGALILSTTVFITLILELSFRPNLLRWCLPVDESQNVYATVACAAQAGAEEEGAAACPQQVVITAHLDTHRTPWVFSSPGWLQVFRVLLPAGLVSVAVLLVLFSVGVFVPAAILRQIALIPGAVMLVILVLMAQAEFTPYTAGADDNASGVGAVLGLAARLQQTPLQRTQVTLVLTGCEEVGCYGADAFMSAHQAELQGAIHLVVDQVAGAGTNPVVVRGERFLLRAASDPRLLTIADEVRAQHPELNVGSLSLGTAYGELSVGVKHHLHAIALGSLRPDGTSPNWHKASDVMANVDAGAFERSEEFAWLLLQAIDGAAKE